MRPIPSPWPAGYRYWHRAWQENPTAGDHPLLRLGVRIGTLLVVYVLFDRLLMHMSHLPEAYFHNAVIYTGFFRNVFTHWYAVPFLLWLAAGIYFRRVLLLPWQNIREGRSLRFLVVLSAGLLASSFATYDYNLYFDQGHYVDRALLLLLLPLIYWRPVFVFPFLTVLLPVIWQFTVLDGYSWAVPFLLIRVLILFFACFFPRGLIQRFPLTDFVFLTGCLFAAHYWVPGWGKLSWTWVRYDQLFLILPSSYANGWLNTFDIATISAVAQVFYPFNGLFKVSVLILEAGAFLFFLHRRSPGFFLLGWGLFHAGIFLFTGICFWMWMILGAGFLWLLLRKDGFLSLPVFTWSHFVIGVLLIIGGQYWCKPVTLAWYDLPFSYTYRIEAETRGGRIRQLPPGFFAPYEYQFIIPGLAYLSDEPLLLVRGVKKDADFARQLMDIHSAEQLFVAETMHGIDCYAPDRAAQFERVVTEFVVNWNHRLSKTTCFSYFRPPELLWHYQSTPAWKNPEPIRQIKIFQVTSLFNDGQYADIRKRLIYKIAIP